MSVLSGADLLKPAARRYCVVPLPDGRKARIQSLFSGEMRAIRETSYNSKGEFIVARHSRIPYLLVAKTVVDDAGTRQFSDAQAQGAEFDVMDGAVFGTLVEYIKQFTGFVVEVDMAAVNDAIKNSSGDPPS